VRRERSGSRRRRSVLVGLAAVVLTLAPGAHGLDYTLSWTDNAHDEHGFRVQRRVGSAPYVEIAILGADVTTFVDPVLEPDAAHCYRVRAFNAAGDSGYSNEACASSAAVGGAPPAGAPEGGAPPEGALPGGPSSPEAPATLAVILRVGPRSIRAGDTLEFSVQGWNLGPERLVDVRFGVVLPASWGLDCPDGAGTAFLLFEDNFTRTTSGCLSSLWSGFGEPLVRGLVIPAELPPTASPTLLRFAWPGDLPPGAYTFFLGLSEPGGPRPDEWLVLIGRRVLATAG
jgi:hypothetical protein